MYSSLGWFLPAAVAVALIEFRGLAHRSTDNGTFNVNREKREREREREYIAIACQVSQLSV